METKNKKEKLERIRRSLNFTGFDYVNPRGVFGGLALWWNNDVEVSVLSSYKNLIHTEVQFLSNKLYASFSLVYGPNDFSRGLLILVKVLAGLGLWLEISMRWHLTLLRMEDCPNNLEG